MEVFLVDELYDAFAPKKKKEQNSERYENKNSSENSVKRHPFLQYQKSKFS
jgi:hypothetical protein